MKKNIKSALGLTQQEVAMILNVSQSHLSHHEGYRRNLPNAALMRLNQMHNYMISPEAKAFKTPDKHEYEEGETKQILKKRLDDNEFKLLKLPRKIEKAQEKFEKCNKAVQVMAFLNSPDEAQKAPKPEILEKIQSKVIMDFRKVKSELSLLQIDEELLQLQHRYLQKKLREI